MPAGTAIIGFNALTNNGSPVSSYSESGFSISAASASWQAVTTYGHPAPFIEFPAPAGTTVAGEVRVSADGAAFSFTSVDLYSSTAISYVIRGLRNGLTVFDFAGIRSNNFGNFTTVLNPDVTAVIDTLSIVLTNDGGCCGNPMGLDTIVLTR